MLEALVTIASGHVQPIAVPLQQHPNSSLIKHDLRDVQLGLHLAPPDLPVDSLSKFFDRQGDNPLGDDRSLE
jgi:hypothetical protein